MNASGTASRVVRAALAAGLVIGGAWPAAGQAPLLRHPIINDPPLPPPCAVDGACRPKRDTFGYYSTRWRPWPGERSPTETSLDAERGLPPVEPIDPKLEDREAPAPSEEVGIDSDEDRPQPDLPALPPVLRPGAPAPGDAAEPPPAPRGGPLLPPRGASSQPPNTAPPGLHKSPRVALAIAASRRGGGSTPGPGAADGPPSLPRGLPGANRPSASPGRWVGSSDAPPMLPNELATRASRIDREKPAADRPASPDWTRAAEAAGTDSAIRRTNGTTDSPSVGVRAFYEPDSPPRFLLGFERDR